MTLRQDPSHPRHGGDAEQGDEIAGIGAGVVQPDEDGLLFGLKAIDHIGVMQISESRRRIPAETA